MDRCGPGPDGADGRPGRRRRCPRYEENPIVTVEDPFDKDDWDNWSAFTAKNGKEFQVVGDDLTVTNTDKITRAVNEKSCTCLLLKVNQIGSIT